MIDYNITMNFECTKIKQIITNGNCDGLLFVMCNNTTIEIIEMLMVMMICSDVDGLVTTQNTSYNIEFVNSNGPKQMLCVQCAQ
jgi:hypothetical protein